MFTVNPTKWICEPKLFSSDAVRFISTNVFTLMKIGLPSENSKKYILDTDVLDANTKLIAALRKSSLNDTEFLS